MNYTRETKKLEKYHLHLHKQGNEGVLLNCVINISFTHVQYTTPF